MSKQKDKILHFKTFKDGWYFGDGISFKDSVIDKAIELNSLAEERDIPINVFAGIHGGIKVVIYNSDDVYL